jgi:predicted acetyltransferase
MEQSRMRSLWKRAFHDSEKYMDYYFSHKMPASEVYTLEEAGELVSMAFFTPYEICLNGKKCRSFYIVGVATEEKHRHRHHMTAMLKQALEQCREETPLVFLCPENPSVYRSLGVLPVYRRVTTYISAETEGRREKNKTADGQSTEQILAWTELDLPKKEIVCSFANEMLANEHFDLYIRRSREYYDEISRELHALDGGLLTAWNTDGAVDAVLHVIYEENRYQITECIVKPSCAGNVVQALLCCLHTDFLQFDDSYFLREFTDKAASDGKKEDGAVPGGSGREGMTITIRQQERPYIMCKILDTENTCLPTKCYINDIT